MASAGFDLFPVAQYACCRPCCFGIDARSIPRGSRRVFSEHMRMTAHELAIQMVKHLGDREAALVRCHLCIKQHLQQQVAEFFGKMRKVSPLDGVEDLVGLFERVLTNGIESLLAVPGAATRRTQSGHDRRRLCK